MQCNRELINSLNQCFPHLDSGDVPLKTHKRNILESIGFDDGAFFDQSEIYSVSDRSILLKKILHDLDSREITLRYQEDCGVAGGNYPCCYLNELSDQNKLIFDQDCWIGFYSTRGERIIFSEAGVIDLFLTKRSIKTQLSNLDHENNIREVYLGGGFVLQLDSIDYTDGIVFKFTLLVVFNDLGPRLTHLDTEFAYAQPHKSYEINLTYRDGKFSCDQADKLDSVNQVNAGQYGLSLIDKILEQDGQALFLLFSNLMLNYPKAGIHSCQGIFRTIMINGKPTIVTKIIDFDGIDTIKEAERQRQTSVRNMIAERLIRAQLSLSGIEERAAANNYDQYLVQAEQERVKLYDSLVLSDLEKEWLRLNLSLNGQFYFPQELLGPVILARILKNRKINWEIEKKSGVKSLTVNNNFISMISICGFELAFWRQETTEGAVLKNCCLLRQYGDEAVLFKQELIGIIKGPAIIKPEIDAIKEGD